MKRVNNLYESLYDFKNILSIYKQVKSKTKNKYKIEQYEHFLLLNLTKIKKMLKNKNVKFDRYTIFIIKEPKYRIIMSQSINDKIINHLVAKNILLKVFEPSLIDGNVATRKNKGTLYGVKLIKKYINDLKRGEKTIYYLKCDITKFFYSIDHYKLMSIIERKIKDKYVLELIRQILNTTNDNYIQHTINKLVEIEKEKILNKSISSKARKYDFEQLDKIPNFAVKNKGIPIGSMTSQAFAIIYLNGLDHYIKENLHIKYYVRYMDDFVLLHHDKKYLKYCYKVIKDKIEEEFKLKLNDKTAIGMIGNNNSLNFLGYRFYLGKTNKLYMKIRNSTKKKFKRKLKKMSKLYKRGHLKIEDFNQVIASYLGHFKHANTYSFIKQNLYSNTICENDIGKFVRISENGNIIEF